MTKRRWYDSHPDKLGYRERDQLKRDPTQKLYSCFPTKFVRFHFGDNDFWWELKNAVPLALERLTWCREEVDAFKSREDFVAEALSLAFQGLCLIGLIRGSDPIPPPEKRHDYSTWKVKVEFIDHIDTRYDNGDTVYLDCWSGELY